MTNFRYSVFVLVVCYVVNIQKFMMPHSQLFQEVDLETEEILDGVWTPAEVIQIFLNNFRQPEAGLKEASKKALS